MKKVSTTNITKNEKRMKMIEELYHQGDFIAALSEVNHYLSLNPNDFNALLLHGKLLRMLKLNDEARLSLISLFPYLNNKQDKIKVLIELIYLEIYERNYLDAYSYLERLQKLNCTFTNSLNIELASIYLLHQTGMNTKISANEQKNYFEQQISFYQEREFLKRLLSNNNGGFPRFDDAIDLEDLYNRIKEVLPYAKITPTYNLFDTYIFYCPLVGYNVDGVCDYVKVLAYRDNSGYHLLEILPFRVNKYKNYINDLVDLEYQKEFQKNLLN
jgi:hypothetical protein